MALLQTLNGLLWGAAGVSLLAGAGLWLTVRCGFFPLRRAGLWLRATLGALLRGSPDLARAAPGAVSPFGSLCTALGATIGTGSVAGVAAALVSGGPGAVFWMWVTALLGMSTAYAENLLALRWRRRVGGRWLGGPMYYLADGLGSRPGCRRLGRALGALYAALCLLASFGIGNLSQSSAIALSLQSAFGLPPAAVGLALAAATALVVRRGGQGVADAAARLVPLMAAFYLTGTALVALLHIEAVPAAFGAIFRGALGLRAAGGGAVGYGVAAAVRWGCARGSFSSEAGLGSAAIAAGSAATDQPVQQGMWGIFQVFVSTFAVCTMTALAILTAGLVDLDTGRMVSPSPAPALPGEAFAAAFGPAGPALAAGAVLLFAWSSILGWCQYGAVCWGYLFGAKTAWAYRLAFLALLPAGAVAGFSAAWGVSDLFNGLMMLPNLVGLLALSGQVRAETDAYLARRAPQRSKQKSARSRRRSG